MPEITVKIPDGDYCADCNFMEHYDYPLVDIMGNETGNRRSGYKCRYYKSELQVEDFGCYQKIKKCFWCTLSDEERNAIAIGWALLYGKVNEEDKNQENNKNI